MFIQRLIVSLAVVLMVAAGCSAESKENGLKGVGLLIEDTIDDQGWNSKGYQGLLTIHSTLDVHVDFREEVNSKVDVINGINDFIEQDINLIFGHGQIYADYFSQLSEDYPDVHFVSFNGEVTGENVTNLEFDSYAMGFFAGMVGASTSQSSQIGAIAAYPWQPELEGYKDGAKYIDPEVEVKIEYVNDWSDTETAIEYFYQLKEKNIDVFYPAGDGFHVEVIEKVKQEGLYAIGYVGDQSDLGEATVLTSTIQHVDELYELVAAQYQAGTLEPGNHTFDFTEGVISLGEFSSQVPQEVQDQVKSDLNTYIETGELPNQ
ncbi:BMP family ABC transporter substrate-binding protein [Alkalihalophilus marmarensis]|uniref:Transcriptional regulator n=1 Tax=Alkalihalophilus marmarensis DSM 21297 TaxID=1188261 RepID=U6SNJ6_9BACI|nr:BMP family ABC transporter substrate-binding protein [Alkalihalophilus marmarensis]ERN52937.1 transcriptional regulator [Alkalihalophilus marmarensis DSM 21297]MCM3489190.1 BMP family ABC transporter substrate-binding protein [Alkalihalophilus marmarensis]